MRTHEHKDKEDGGPPKFSRRGRVKKPRPIFELPTLIPAADAEKLTELTDTRLRMIAGDGYFPLPVRAWYDFEKLIKGLLAFYRASLHNRQPMTDARLAKMAAEKAKLDLEIRRLSGKSIDTKAVAEAFVKLGAGIKQQLYQGLEKEMPARAGVDADTAARLAVLGREMADQIVEKMGASLKEWMEAAA